MAIDKAKQTVRSERPEGGVPQGRRWLRYGSNVALAVVLATILAGAILWFSAALLKGKARSDWTASGRFSLSKRTTNVLKSLSEDISLDFVYPDPDQYQYATPEEYRRDRIEYDRTKDLLDGYDLASPHVSLRAVDPLNPVQTETYLKDLKDAFSEGFERKQKLLDDFTKFRDKMDAFVGSEIQTITAFGKLSPPPPVALRQSLTGAANELLSLSKKLQRKMLGEMMGAALEPGDEKATLDEAKSLTAGVADSFKEYPAFYKRVLDAAEKGQFGGPIPDEVKTFLASAAGRFDPLREEAETLKKQLANPPEAKFDDIEQRFQYRSKFVVVRSKADVAVLGPEDIWLQRPGGSAASEGVFAGERAVTAAVMGVSSAAKTGVLFVTFGSPATGWGGPYSRLADRLRSVNFVVEDWDLMRDPQMPVPEKAEKVVLVLVPPPPPNPQQPMPPPQPESYAPAVHAVESGAPALIMAEAASMFAPPVPYSDLFKALGVQVKFDAIAVHKVVVDQEGTEQAIPEIPTTEYPKSVITKPLGALPSYFITPVPVMRAEGAPADIKTEPLVLLPVGSDYWAETNTFTVQSGGAERDVEKDIIPTAAYPVPLAMAVARPVKIGDKEVEQRVIVFGDSEFAQDRVAFYRGRAGTELFPGNAELVTNSILWAAGKDDLIAVSPEALAARRISEMPGLAFIEILMIAVLPVLAGVLGIVVLVLRRR